MFFTLTPICDDIEVPTGSTCRALAVNTFDHQLSIIDNTADLLLRRHVDPNKTL